jgi:hypothetical protein
MTRLANARPQKSRTKPSTSSIYSVHPGVTMVQHWIATLHEKTGRSLEQWGELIKADGPASEKQRVAWLKDEFELSANTALWLAESVGGTGTWDGDPNTYLRAAAVYVANMYAEAKAELRPLHDRLIEIARNLGGDVKVCPCRTVVPLYRRHIFAEIKPATNARIELGLALGETSPSDRLLAYRKQGSKSRLTHRINVRSVADIDDELRHRLRVAYNLDGKS